MPTPAPAPTLDPAANPHAQLSILIEQRAEQRAAMLQHSTTVNELAASYAPCEDHPDGKQMPDDVYNRYNLAAQQHRVTADRINVLDVQITDLNTAVAIKDVAPDLNINDAFRDFTFKGHGGMATEHQEAFLTTIKEGRYAGQTAFDLKAALTTTGTGADNSGAAAVPEEHADGVLVQQMKAFGGVMELVSVLQTNHGRNIPVPNVDTTAQVGIRLTENTLSSDLDLPDIGDTTLLNSIYSSRVATISHQMLRDASFDVVTWVSGALSTRLSRQIVIDFTTGDGANNSPRGFMTDIATGKSISAATGLQWPDLLDLINSVDEGYLMGPAGHGIGMGGTIGFAMNRSTIIAIMQLADTQKRPLFIPSLHGTGEMQLFGYPIHRVYDMDGIAAGNKAIAFGNFGYYIARVTENSEVLRFDDSAYAKRGVSGFLSYAECDGRWIQQLTAAKVTAAKALAVTA